MKHTWVGAGASLCLFLAGQLAAQPRELRGQIFHVGENGEKIWEKGLIVTFLEIGATDDTNDQGIFRLPLPPTFQPGDSVTISIDTPSWRIRYPLDGEARVPRDLLREIVPVELLQVGSKLFWTHDRIEKFIRDASERSKQEGLREGEAPSLDLGRAIKDWAEKYGFSAQEVREEIDRWIAEVEAAHEDSYQKGLTAFVKQQFDKAAERFRDSAEWRIRQLDETRKQQETLAQKADRLQEEVVRDLRLEGDSHYYAYRYQKALTVYEQAHQYTSKDHTPRFWGATLNDIGRTHRQLGIRVEAAESSAHLTAAVQAHRQALLVHTREQTPQDWAGTQNNLGAVLSAQATRTAGEEGKELLVKAIQAHRQALLVYTREQMPEGWARAQNNLGIALQAQAVRTVGTEGIQLLAQAVQAYRQALLVRTREQLPQRWADTQNGLGTALRQQGTRMAGEEGAQLLAQAVQAHRQALLVNTREQRRQEWAATQNSLGLALQEQARRIAGKEGAQLVAQAVQAFRQAFLVYSREQLPQQWAMTQNNLGNALQEQGMRTAGEEGAQLLAQAVQAFQQAVLVRTREQLPQDWAITQNNLGTALLAQGVRTAGEKGQQLFAQAVQAYRQALLIFTPAHFPQWWALARANEAQALLALGRYEEATEAVSEVLVKEPEDRQVFLQLIATLNDQLFHHQEAVAHTRSWLSRHPDDLLARLSLGEQLFASRAFPDCSQEISSLLKEQELDAESRVVALGYAIAAGLAMESPEVADRVEELLGFVAAQPQDFSTYWTFEGTLHSLGEGPEVPQRDLLIRLFQALEAPDRDSLLAGLRELKGTILPEDRPTG